MSGQYIVFDNDGIIHESSNYDEALNEYEETEDFEGDLIFCQEIFRRA